MHVLTINLDFTSEVPFKFRADSKEQWLGKQASLYSYTLTYTYLLQGLSQSFLHFEFEPCAIQIFQIRNSKYYGAKASKPVSVDLRVTVRHFLLLKY